MSGYNFPSGAVSRSGAFDTAAVSSGRTASITLSGVQDVISAMASIEEKLKRKVARKVALEAGRTMVRAVKVSAKARSKGRRYVEDKKLKRGRRAVNLSDTVIQIPTWRQRRRNAYAVKGIIGTLVGFRWPYGNHAHLVEYGHVMVLWGKRTNKRVPAYPFFRPAVQENDWRIVWQMRNKLRMELPGVFRSSAR